MSSTDLQQSPSQFPDRNITHLYRTAEIVVLKRVRNFLLPGLNQSETEFTTFRRDFFEFLPSNVGGKGILIAGTDLDAKWQDPDGPLGVVAHANPLAVSFPLYRHFYVSATALQGSASASTVAPPPRGNADVVSVRASVDTEGRGSCTLELACPQDKYLFKLNPFKVGQALFEPNDQVFVNLPGLDGFLYRVFTGLVSRVTVRKTLGDTLQTRVVLECEDMLKLLTQTRTAVKPSLTPSMSDGKFFAGMENDFSSRLPHDVMSEIMGQAYGDFFTAQGYGVSLNQARSDPNPTNAARREYDLNRKMTKIPTPNPAATSFNPKAPFLACAQLAPGSSAFGGQVSFNTQTTTTQTSTLIPAKIYGFRRARKSVGQASTAIDQAVKPWAPAAVTNLADMDDVAFIITGTAQPNFKLAFGGSPDLYFADFKSGLALLKQIADDLEYEIFANHAGIVLFRPLNVSLPFDLSPAFPARTTAQLKGTVAKGRVGFEYWLQDKLVQAAPEFSDTDSDIFTYAYVSGEYQTIPGKFAFNRGMAVDINKYLKFGARTAPLVSRLQLKSNKSCNIYAAAYLNRLNANYSSASVQYTGDARLQAGNPCFFVSRRTIYYIAAVTHTFVAGQSYSTTLTLKYGRRPLAVTGATAIAMQASKNSAMSALGFKKSLATVLTDLSNIGGNTLLGGKTMAAFINANQANLTFQNFIWEPLLPLDYESLYVDLGEQYAFQAVKQVVENSNVKSQAYTTQQQIAQRKNPALVPQSQALANATVGGIMQNFGVSTATKPAVGT